MVNHDDVSEDHKKLIEHSVEKFNSHFVFVSPQQKNFRSSSSVDEFEITTAGVFSTIGTNNKYTYFNSIDEAISCWVEQAELFVRHVCSQSMLIWICEPIFLKANLPLCITYIGSADSDVKRLPVPIWSVTATFGLVRDSDREKKTPWEKHVASIAVDVPSVLAAEKIVNTPCAATTEADDKIRSIENDLTKVSNARLEIVGRIEEISRRLRKGRQDGYVPRAVLADCLDLITKL